MSQLLRFLKREPAVVSATGAIVSWGVLQLLDVVEAAGGEWALIITSLLGAAGITRQRVSPTGD